MDQCCLPEDLVFKIFARLPFPNICRLRCLSKRWDSILSGDESSGEEVKAFQDGVRSVGSSWPSYVPLQIRAGKLLGFDARAHRWTNIPMHPRNHSHLLTLPRDPELEGDVIVRSSGPLMCRHQYRSHYDTLGSFGVMVANIFTGKFKHLKTPVLAREAFEDFEFIGWAFKDLVFHAHKCGFTVVLLHSISNCRANQSYMMIHVYESHTGSWYRDFIENDTWHGLSLFELTASACPVLVDDSKVVVAVTFPSFSSSLVLGTYDVKTKQWSCVHIADPQYRAINQIRIGKCGSRIIVVVSKLITDGNGSTCETSILEFTEHSPELELLNQGRDILITTRDLFWNGAYGVSSDEKRVYMSRELGIHAYHLDEGTCTRLPPVLPEGGEFEPVAGVFSPGLNPFCDPSALDE